MVVIGHAALHTVQDGQQDLENAFAHGTVKTLYKNKLCFNYAERGMATTR